MVGRSDGIRLGLYDGLLEGFDDEIVVGLFVEKMEGSSVGFCDWEALGRIDGFSVVSTVGLQLGFVDRIVVG